MNTLAAPLTDLILYREKSVAFQAYYAELEGWTSALKSGTLSQEEHPYSKYYPINLQRMKRGIKQIKLSDEIRSAVENVDGIIEWFVLTEQWCGDAAQSLPLFHKLTQEFPAKLTLRILCRDQNLELMDQFLTDGGRSIPKVIQVNSTGRITGAWGPRPAPAQGLVKELRAQGKSYNDDLHAWYAKDKHQTLQAEITRLINQAASA